MASRGNVLSIYDTHAQEWWNQRSPYFRSLLSITPYRLGLIEEMIGSADGKVVVDLGCGGGLIAVPLLNKGANVIGVDLSEASLNEARFRSDGRGEFIQGDARTVELEYQCADVVVLADLVDHISDYAKVLENAARILRPGGRAFVSTINRTVRSRVLAISLAEGIGLIPRGTHDYRMFVRPSELINAASGVGLKLDRLIGQRVQIVKTLKYWAIAVQEGKSLALGYAAYFTRE